MANPEHVAVVRSGAATIEAFRAANTVVNLDLICADLTDADLTDADLTNANMYDANLRGANLRGAILVDANLGDANISEADLSGADLTKGNLSGANLIRATLTGVNSAYSILSDANLTDVNLSGADLTNADLSDANLSYANLSFTNLMDADLNNANFTYTNLTNANLTGANFSNAIIYSTSFGNLDLSEVFGLDSTYHAGPSSIGIDTLFRSNGNIPEVFLRGCGLSDDFIAYIPSLVGMPFDFYSCFISYSHKDKQFARQLHDRLQGKGIRCWLDEKELNPGDDLYHGIDRGIRVWDKVLLCSSKHSLSSWWCDNEIKIALDKERELQKDTGKKLLKIIPLNLDGFLFSDEWESGYRTQIRDRVAADFTKWKKDADEFDRQFEGVLKALRTDGGKLPEPKSKLT